MPESNQREFSRVEVELDIVLEADGFRLPPAHSRDLCANGVMVASERLLPVGTACDLTLSFPEQGDAFQVKVQGTVARVADGVLGVEFTTIDAESFQNLQRILCLHAEEPDRVEQELREHLGIRRNRG